MWIHFHLIAPKNYKLIVAFNFYFEHSLQRWEDKWSNFTDLKMASAQHCTVAYKTENWAFICRCLTDLCMSPCRSEKDALQQLHKTLGYISWALDQKTNFQPLRIHLHSFILQGQKLLPLQTELTHRLGCSACWSISEGVFKSSSQTAAQRLLGGSEREGKEGGAPTPLEIRHHIPNSSLEDNEKGGCRAKQHCSAGWWCHPPIHIWTQRPCPCLDTKVGGGGKAQIFFTVLLSLWGRRHD